jgi:tetratricopeptide (TPR) repeat protein
MKTSGLSAVLTASIVFVLLTPELNAQGRGGGGSTGRPGGVSPRPSLTAPDTLPGNNMRGPMFLSGKVMVDDGIPLTDPVLIQSVCRGRTRTEGYTDSKGSFSFQLGGPQEMMGFAEDSSPGVSTANSSLNSNRRRDLRDCDLQAVLPGFTSQSIELTTKILDFTTADVGTIVLHRMQQVEGLTISATSALAPDKARRNFEKGREDEKKEKWDAAKEKFAKATEIYPKYAVAWFELGRTQLATGDVAEAKTSFHQALTADPKFVSPLEQLAGIAVKEQNWKEVEDATDQLLKLNPLSFPQVWFYNSAAHFNLQVYDKAEKSARQGLSIDVQHRYPKLEYLLGLILTQKRDYQGAVVHLRNYMRLSPNEADAQTAQKQVAELEKFTAPTPASANPAVQDTMAQDEER